MFNLPPPSPPEISNKNILPSLPGRPTNDATLHKAGQMHKKKKKKNFNPTSEEKAEGKRIMYSTYFQRRFTNEKKSDRKDIKQERLQQQHVQYCSPAPSSLPADISPFSPYAFSPRLLSVPSFILALVYSHSIVYPFPPLFFFPFHSRDCILFLTFFPCLFPSYPLLSSPLLYIPLDPCHDTVKKI